jgi:hypothetical protein
MPLLIQQNIARLQVAVNDPPIVSIGNRLRDLLHQVGGFLGRERPFPHASRQGAAFDEGHREVVLALEFADFVDWHYAGMIELGRRFCFRVKAIYFLLGSNLPGQNHF